MLRVLIADDEKKVCRLIQMLCDWEQLGMELAGVAYNGEQALEMIEEKRPDILITDICMPGIDGLEIIRRIREKQIYLEVLIISGYADFKYAQSAIHYGVSEYLLKPIKKDELQSSLTKLGARCLQEKAHREASHQLLQYMEDDNLRKRCSFVFDLLLGESFYGKRKNMIPDLEEINKRYQYHFVSGLFRILILKLDYDPTKYDSQAVASILEGVEEIVKSSLAEKCSDLELCTDGSMCYILCNYPEDGSHEFRQAVRRAVDWITVKRFQLWETTFSIGMGRAVNDCTKLDYSMNTALTALKERLLEGCEKLLEPPDVVSENDFSEMIDDFNSQCARAIELLDEKMALDSVESLKKRMLTSATVTGGDLLNVVQSVGVHAITAAMKEESNGKITEFQQSCERCSSADALFCLLSDTLIQMIATFRKQSEEEQRRPIRVAKQYIHNHYMEPISLEMVADIVGFSSSYFSSLFKKEAGIGLGDYLIRVRMERAKDLLKNTKINIKDICVQVGYSDLKHFTANFRKYTGLKPGEYRKLYK